MAKPGFASLPASSSSPRRPNASPSTSSHPPNRSNRSRPRTRILALLATFSAAPLSAHAYPLDPTQTSLPFLYPPSVLQPPALAKRSAAATSASDAAPTTSPPPSPSSPCQYDRANLPDKYVLGEDGLWHKTQWSIYGSAYCPGPCLTSPTAVIDNASGDISDPGGPMFHPPSSFDEFDTSSLPTGWTDFSVTGSSHRSTVVVLALSVVLALVIIIMMFACIFWRRKHTPKRDPEKRRRRSLDVADDNSLRSIREAKVAQRKWSKAVIRWRDNLRLSAHRRRTNRAIAPTTSYSTLPQEEGIDVRSSLSRSRPSSPALSQRSVTPTPSDVRSSSLASIHSSHSPIQTPRTLTPTDLPPSSPPPTQPPAYDPPPELSENTYSNGGPSGTSKALLSSHTQSRPYGDDDGHLTALSGHVATDDKAILSLRTALASAPPESSSNFPQPASVPSMEDEDTIEWPSGSRPSSPGFDEYAYEPHPPYSPPTTLLPPPPSKGKQRFDYSHDLDISVNPDNAFVEPQLGPSAPPFEECEAMPSAPPLDLDAHVPSAPPMDPEDCPDITISGAEDGVDEGTTSMIPAPVVLAKQTPGDEDANTRA